MDFGYKKKTYSRRDILFSLFGNKNRRDTPDVRTGLGALEQEIQDKMKNEDYPKAVELLNSLLKKSPDHLQAREKLGYCYLRTDRLAEAQDEFNKVLKVSENRSFSWLYLGLVLVKQGNTQDGVLAWKNYYNLDQPLIQRAVNLQTALYDTGGPSTAEEMVECIEEAIKDQQKQDKI